nr:unnamed protein product [Callosobruchus chinensis]
MPSREGQFESSVTWP